MTSIDELTPPESKEQAPMALKVDLKDRLTWSLSEAALMCGVSTYAYKKWVREGIMPLPMPGKRHYNAYAVRNALISMTGASSEGSDAYSDWRATQS